MYPLPMTQFVPATKLAILIVCGALLSSTVSARSSSFPPPPPPLPSGNSDALASLNADQTTWTVMSFTETVEEAVFGFDFLIIPVNFQTSVTNINVGLVEPGIPPLPDGSRLLSDYAFFSGGPPASVVLYSDPFPVSPPPTSTTIGDNAVILMKTGGWQDIGQYLGLVPGTLYAFSDLSEVPLPTTLPLFATGIGGLGLLGWRRKRKVRAAA